MLPTTEFLGRQVSRLTLGDNPTNGYSYIPDMVSRAEMLSFYTEERLIQQLFEAEEYGYTVWQPLATDFTMRALRHYREQGGKIDVIFQSHVPMNFQACVRQIAEYEPFGMYLQGTEVDGLIENGKADEIPERIEFAKQFGFKVGLATHVPEHLMMAEEQGWGADFYMACLHNTRKGGRGELSTSVTGKKKKTVTFDYEDRELMLDTIAKVKKPCIAYKILMGGQIYVDRDPSEFHDITVSAIKQVYERIKPGDIATVGIFQKHANQLKEDAEIVEKILA